MVQARSRLVAIAAIVAAMVLAAAGSLRGGAQDATPMAGAGMAAIPNHIHQGTCDNLSPDILVPLADAQFTTSVGAAGTPTAGTPMADAATPIAGMGTPVADMASPMASPIAATVAGEMTVGSAAIPVAVGVTQIDLTINDLLASSHAINAHDPNDPSRFIACGTIGGTPDADGNLFVGLQELNGSGHSGVAWLLSRDTGTTVTVFIAAYGTTGGGLIDDGAMATPTA